MITISRKVLALIVGGVLIVVGAAFAIGLVVSAEPDGPERFESVQEFADAFVAATNPTSLWRTKTDPAADLAKVAMGACNGTPTPEQVTRVAKLSYAMDLDNGGALYVAQGITEAELVDLRVRSLGLCDK